MNATLEFIKSRRTCRKFIDKQITDDELQAVLEAGLYAPSGMNRQESIFIAVQDKEIIAELSKINTAIWGKGEDAFFAAPTVIVVLSNPNIAMAYQINAMACVQNMLIAAESLGLGAACISRAKEEFESEYGKNLLKRLGIDKGYVGVENILLGYRDGEKPEPLPRKENRIFLLK